MFDFQSLWRDVQENPINYPFLRVYSAFMNIKRYDKFPFYIYPSSVSISGFEDGVLKFLDHLVDAHEIERNKSDANRSFYQRSNYVATNFHRYSNDTMANVMFDTKARQTEYDRLNSVIDWSTQKYYAAATLTHIVTLCYFSYLFRFRRLNKVQTFAVGTGYYYYFGLVNNLLYSGIVDRSVGNEADRLGLGFYRQANGSVRPRGHNF